MTDGSRILRTVGAPLAVALIFLFVVPKTCQKVVGSRKLRVPKAAAPATTDTELHINSQSPDGPSSHPIVYPAGLDAQGVQYLIEVDQRFAGPMIIRIPKPGSLAVDPMLTKPFVRAGWFEPAGDGFAPTREASLHLSALTEEPLAWLVPVGTRKFGRVSSLVQSDGKVHIAFTWQWEPNEAGRTMKSSGFDLHRASAEFAGGGEHPWDLGSLEVDSEWR
jgi:hypothetical protein